MRPEVAASPGRPGPVRRPIRLTIIDDNPFLRTPDGRVHPRAATFHRFAEAVVRAGPFGIARYVIPVRDADDDAQSPNVDRVTSLQAVDESLLRIVPSAPFDGAAGYLRHLPSMWRHNLPLLRRTLRGEHLVWIKVPGSNGAAAALAAGALAVPHFTYVVGSVREVVAASPRSGPTRVAALGAAALHDAVNSTLQRTGPSILLGPELFTSALDAVELPDTTDAPAAALRGLARDRRPEDAWRISWAGRLAPEKGLGTLLRAVTLLLATGRDVQLTLLGDGPERPRLEAQAHILGITEAIHWEGYVGERGKYLARLQESDLFVLPSLSEGVPKVLLEAIACGVPVIASAVGGIPALLGDGRLGRLVRPNDEIELATAIRSLLDDARARQSLRDDGLTWAAEHTAQRQAERLVRWMRATFPGLLWPAEASA